MSQRVIVNKIKQTQQDELKALVEEMRRCGICKKNKHHLYFCEYDGCDQAQRLLCKRCGVFTHDPEEEGYNHAFDISRAHIKQAQLQLALNTRNDVDIKKHVKEIHYMVKSMEEQRESVSRNVFQTTVTHTPNAIDALQSIGDFIPRTSYWTKAIAKMGSALKNRNMGTLGTQMKTVFFDLCDGGLERGLKVKEGAVIAGAFLFGLEATCHTYRFIKGDISLKNYGKNLLGAAAMSTGAMVGNIGGAAVGSTIGVYVLPIMGSAICGAIGGFLAAIFVGVKAKKAIEEISWFNDLKEQQARHVLIKDALTAFGFTWEHINNEDVFNTAKIAKKYRTRAKEAHPDRGGSQKEFITLNMHLSILLALLEQDDNIKQTTSKKIEAITWE